jgi:hypothetical protein
VNAHLLHGLNIAGAGTEGDAVEDVNDFVAIGHGFLGLGRRRRQDQADSDNQRKKRSA